MSEQPKDAVDELVEVVDDDLLERAELADDPEERRLEAQTDEGDQQLRPMTRRGAHAGARAHRRAVARRSTTR